MWVTERIIRPTSKRRCLYLIVLSKDSFKVQVSSLSAKKSSKENGSNERGGIM